ncbi:hypothetical protein JCM5296_006003 [Sporobolomyces johnsonii]
MASPASASHPLLTLDLNAPLERFDFDALIKENEAAVAADEEKLAAILQDLNSLYQDVVCWIIRSTTEIDTLHRELMERSFDDISQREECEASMKHNLSACLDTIAGALSRLFGFAPSASAAPPPPAIAPLMLVDPKEPVERLDVEGARMTRQAADAEDDEKLNGASVPSFCLARPLPRLVPDDRLTQPNGSPPDIFRQVKELFDDIAVGITVHMTAMDKLCADNLHETVEALRASEAANERTRHVLATFVSGVKSALETLVDDGPTTN